MRTHPTAAAVLGAVVLTLAAGIEHAGAQPKLGERGNDPLEQTARNMAGVRLRVTMSLPTLRHGVRLLTRAQDQETMQEALVAIYDSYKYLRAAYEGSQSLNNGKRFPNPLVEMQNEQIMAVRQTLIRCLDLRVPLMHLQAQAIEFCDRTLTDAIPKLEIITELM